MKDWKELNQHKVEEETKSEYKTFDSFAINKKIEEAKNGHTIEDLKGIRKRLKEKNLKDSDYSELVTMIEWFINNFKTLT